MCGISEFEENEKKCVYFVHNCLHFLQLYSLKYTTYKPSHRSHTITPLSNHHTIIILKSIELRNICIYLFLFVGCCQKVVVGCGLLLSSFGVLMHFLFIFETLINHPSKKKVKFFFSRIFISRLLMICLFEQQQRL